MAHNLLQTLRDFLVHYGYWALAATLFLENSGIPVPGETILLLASFLAFSERHLHLGWIIVVATAAATLGDNLGYAIGRRGGRSLLNRYRNFFHIHPNTIAHGEDLFRRYGSPTVFFARFIFGMRIIAGPLAGVLQMPWRTFALFNFLGAAVWVTTIASLGYFFGSHWDYLLHRMKQLNLAAVLAGVAVVFFLWWRRRRNS